MTMKRLTVILFFAFVAALLYSDSLLPTTTLSAHAQGRGAAQSKYAKFTHASHAGEVRVPGTNKTQNLDCAYCHTLTKEKQVIGAFPNTKPGDNKTHSACTDCHAFTGRQAVTSGVFPAMCLICHSKNETAVTRMKTNLLTFPNAKVVESEFGDLFSHKSHKDYLDKFDCSQCHMVNKEPVTVVAAKFDKGTVMSSPSHPQCFTCHFDEKTITKKNPTYALNCIGCHADMNPKPDAKGKKPPKPPAQAVHFFVRQVIDPVTPEKPFSHEDHSSDGTVKGVSINNGVKGKVSNQTKECLSCHLTGMTAEKRADFFLDPKTKAAQPVINGCKDCAPVNGCLNCHQRNAAQKIEGAVKLETSKCTYCHSVPMMKAKAASGLPPASHLGQTAAPATSATPATPTPATPKPDTKPPAKPAATTTKPEPKPPAPANKPEVKAEPKPAPATTSTVQPSAKPDNPPPAASPSVSKTEPPKQATVTPPATPVLTPTNPPAAATTRQPLPTQMKLGDPKVSKEWGLDAKWGLVEFDHTTHVKPSYAERCEVCHHTNKDARNEAVAKCTSCHLAVGNPKNPQSKGGEEVDVKLAYHGDPANEKNNAGCIVCHQRTKETKPDANAPTKCAECHELKNAGLRWPPMHDSSEKTSLTPGYDLWYPQSHPATVIRTARPAQVTWVEACSLSLRLWLTLTFAV